MKYKYRARFEYQINESTVERAKKKDPKDAYGLVKYFHERIGEWTHIVEMNANSVEEVVDHVRKIFPEVMGQAYRVVVEPKEDE